MNESYIKEAFAQICQQAKAAEGRYVVLYENRPYYGGPEEGGWWGNDSIVISYQYFSTIDAAEDAASAIEKLAQELSEQSRREYGEQCANEMDWLNDRGLDANFLPEPDGESEFHVSISETLPENTYGCRHYS